MSLVAGANQIRDRLDNDVGNSGSRRWDSYAGVQAQIPIGDLSTRQAEVHARVDVENHNSSRLMHARPWSAVSTMWCVTWVHAGASMKLPGARWTCPGASWISNGTSSASDIEQLPGIELRKRPAQRRELAPQCTDRLSERPDPTGSDPGHDSGELGHCTQ